MTLGPDRHTVPAVDGWFTTGGVVLVVVLGEVGLTINQGLFGHASSVILTK